MKTSDKVAARKAAFERIAEARIRAAEQGYTGYLQFGIGIRPCFERPNDFRVRSDDLAGPVLCTIQSEPTKLDLTPPEELTCL